MRVGGASQILAAPSAMLASPSALLTAPSVFLTVPFVSPAAGSVFLLWFLAIPSSLLPDLSRIYYLEALEARFAGLIGSLPLLLMISDLGWFPKVDALCCPLTHSDAFGEMGVYRAASPVFVPTLSSWSTVASDGFGLVVCFAAEMLLADGCWEFETWFRFCLDLVFLRLFGVDLAALGRLLAIGVCFPGWCGGRFGGGDRWRLFLSPACLICSRVFALIWASVFCFNLGCSVLGPFCI